MSSSVPAVVCTDLSFAWPDGTTALDGLDATFAAGRTGLVGRNGSGKSTLLRLVAGDLTPASGTVTVSGDVAMLPQHLPAARTVADLLGIAAQRRALVAITAGDTSPEQFVALGDDWDAEERATAVLDRLRLPVDLDRTVVTLSGGEAVLTALAGLILRRATVSLLDEPTNNLDRAARERLYEAVAEWAGVLVVVSHDRELLEHVDQIAELRDGRMRTFAGTFRDYEHALAVEQEAAGRMLRVAETDLRREKRQRIEAETVLARRLRAGNKAEREKRVPKIVAHNRKRQAQVSAAKYRGLHEDRLERAQDAVATAEAAVRDDRLIRISLPATAVPSGRTVLDVDLPGAERIAVRGPERIALRGPNGSGKTTLLRRIIAAGAPVPIGYLPQRLNILDPSRSVLDNVRRVAPEATTQRIRAELARFLLRGAKVDQAAATLSGGERFRATLACLLLTDPAPQLLLLDEPTNNLDLDSVAQLVTALSAYGGALVVASHDEEFLADLGITRTWQLDRGRLTDSAAGPPSTNGTRLARVRSARRP